MCNFDLPRIPSFKNHNSSRETLFCQLLGLLAQIEITLSSSEWVYLQIHLCVQLHNLSVCRDKHHTLYEWESIKLEEEKKRKRGS